MSEPVTLRLTARGVCEEVLGERELQDAKWGEQNHNPVEWMAILTEEVGEAAKEAVEAHFNADDSLRGPGAEQAESLARYRAELVQVAAVAVAMIQSLDRSKWRTQGPNQ